MKDREIGRHVLGIIAVAWSTALALPETAPAAPITCERAIARESSRHLQSTVKALLKCEDRRAAGTIPPSTDCQTDPSTVSLIQRAHYKLGIRVGSSCGGSDRTCGTADDDPLGTIGWGSIGTCPNFENGGCNNSIANCNDIATCLACVDGAAVQQAVSLYYDALVASNFGNHTALNKCQRAIGREAVRFLRRKSMALQRCWDARLKGQHTNACPVPGDGKAGPKIQAAEAAMRTNVCRACGGGDRTCGSGDDFTPSQIGFAANCPAVTVPAGPACASSVSGLQNIVDCVDCVTEFKADCADTLAVPEFTPYPSQCNPTTTTTTTTSTTVSTTATTTTTSTTTTTTTLPACPRGNPPLGQLTLTIAQSTSTCGGKALTPNATAPTTGEVDDGLGAKVRDLGTGCLYFGAGNAQFYPPAAVPDGAKSVLDITGISGTNVTLGGSGGTGPADCSRAAGPLSHCVNGSLGTNGFGACVTDADCGGTVGACDLDANCYFGPPVPVPVPDFGSLSICIVNVIAQDVCGTANLTGGGATTLAASFTARLYLTTGGAASPCPQCSAGMCQGGARGNLACTGSGVGSNHTTIECPPVPEEFVGKLQVSVPMLTTAMSTVTAGPGGVFCPGGMPGAFGLAQVRTIKEMGAALLGNILNPFSTTLAGMFCVPGTGNPSVDNVADLPGPGAVSISGTVAVSLGPPASTTTVVTTTTSTTSTTNTTTTSTTTTTTSGSSTTSTTICGGSCCCAGGTPSQLSFTTVVGSGNCGHLDADGDPNFFALLCGGLYFGGAGVAVPLPAAVPDQGVSVAAAACSQTTLALTGTTPAQTGGNRCSGGSNHHASCTTAADCPGGTCKFLKCTSPGCLFGPPLPIPNSAHSGAASSTCVIDSVAQNANGTADCAAGTATNLSLPLSSNLVLTGDSMAARCVGGSTPGAICGSNCEITPSGSCPGGGTCTNDIGRCTDTGGACCSDADCAAGTCETGACAGGTNAGKGCITSADCPSGTCRTFIQPCPICNATTHICNGGPNNGLVCTPGNSINNGDFPTSHDCPPNPSLSIGSLAIGFNLDSGTITRTSVDLPDQVNVFCGFCKNKISNQFKNPAVACTTNADCAGITNFTSCGQRTAGAFTANDIARTISASGAAAGALTTGGAPKPQTLVSIFCIPPSFNPLVDAAADLPGPGAVSLPVNSQLLP